METEPIHWINKVDQHRNRLENLRGRMVPAIKKFGELALVVSTLKRMWKHNQPEITDRRATSLELAEYGWDVSRIISELTGAMIDRWCQGDFIGFCLYNRLLFEYRAALAYSVRLATSSKEEGWQNKYERCLRLKYGTRYNEEFKPIAGHDWPQSVNISRLIEILDSEENGAEDTYNFLCESCHPNHLLDHYLLHAGSAGNRFSGLIVENWISNILTRGVDIAERTTDDVTRKADHLYSLVEPEMHASKA